MWSRVGPSKRKTPPAPPGSIISEDGEDKSRAASRMPYTSSTDESSLSKEFMERPVDIDLLNELLGSLEGTANNTVNSTPNLGSFSAACNADTDGTEHMDIGDNVDDLAELGAITTEAVLRGLRSLDEFERQAAIHTEGNTENDHDGSQRLLSEFQHDDIADSIFRAAAAVAVSAPANANMPAENAAPTPVPVVSSASAGLGSFNEAELSAALEQIYWGSLDFPLVGDTSIGSHSASASVPSHSSFVLPAPTPAPTPISATVASHDSLAKIPSSWAPSQSMFDLVQHTLESEESLGHLHASNSHVFNNFDEGDGLDDAMLGDEYEDDENDDENPLELEELSLFSLFLSDMKAFEAFLSNLSLNQLRQCAATVNSVLVRRESGPNAEPQSANPVGMQRRADGAPRSKRGNHLSGVHTVSTKVTATTEALLPDPSNPPSIDLGLVLHSDESDEEYTVAKNEVNSAEQEIITQQPGESVVAETAEPHGGSSVMLPKTTLALLREWLPPSTADCVITALQTANLSISGPSNTYTHRKPNGKRPASESNTGGSPNTAEQSSSYKAQSTSIRTKPSALSLATERAADSSSVNPTNTSAADAIASVDNTRTNEPYLETDSENIPRLSFMYVLKGKPKRYCIRIDIDRAPVSAIPSSFKQNNCVYPRANCSKSLYAGNRWNYETECNGLGWKLAFLNQELLTGRRGLLQTAVNNYRTMVAGRKSRRITRLEKAERTQNSSIKALASGAVSSGGAGEHGSDGGGRKRPLSFDKSATAATALSTASTGRYSVDVDSSAEPSEKRTKINLNTADLGFLAEDLTLQLPSPPVTGSSNKGPLVLGCEQINDGQSKQSMALSRTTSAPSVTSTSTHHSPSSSASPQSAKCLMINAYINSKFTRIRVYVDFGSMDDSVVDTRFKREHTVFPRALDAPRSRYGNLQGRWEFEQTCNELSWRLAWLNRTRLKGRKLLIQKCLDAYRAKFNAPPWSLLSCYKTLMNESVDQRFFEYWKPRPGRKSLELSTGSAFLDSASFFKAKEKNVDNKGSKRAQQQQQTQQNSSDRSSAQPVKELDSVTEGLGTVGFSQAQTIQHTMDENTSCLPETVVVVETEPDDVCNVIVADDDLPASSRSSTPSNSGTESAARVRAIRPKSTTINKDAMGIADTQALQTPASNRLRGNIDHNKPTAPSNISNTTASSAADLHQKQPTINTKSTVTPDKAVHPQPAIWPQPRSQSSLVQQKTTTHAKSGAAVRPSTTRPQSVNLPTSANVVRPTVQPQRPPTADKTPAKGSVLSDSSGSGSNRVNSNPATNTQRMVRPPAGVRSVNMPRAAAAVKSARFPFAGSSKQGNPLVKQRPLITIAAPGKGIAATSRPVAGLTVSKKKQQQQLSQSAASPISKQAIAKTAISNVKPLTSAKPTTAQTAAISISTSTSASSESATPTASQKSVKAQAAANVLTDVLRQLAKNNPSLATLTGMLEQRNGQTEANQVARKTKGAQSSAGSKDKNIDDVPLDAKVAELEKLIIDLQKD
ncbi:hypothetical protein GGI25_001107 [Coemansia spiralis]|uniref:DUF8032 domain-containing protein n=2 Tax=Coemansia TaxID=4863 RepID=A0A9W8KYR4_9FUNG|nr:hypothetical protein EDC05_000777 [Coemansia umbellata]KAJ2625129.1 hypothetical protein GGI26_000932 [Coemansia sp. RSA 1358]KAJ2679918.1 hypothetical protein GGI25_001107 [Coemansia spiralis]